ncbi:MAG: carboxypeptidase regulatory-like domain-containing protein [Gemmatimonadetes bacterium]|nr:carboxypeptidase regulatory-like domain-containing protein [Gemmatimonadota bacterium]
MLRVPRLLPLGLLLASLAGAGPISGQTAPATGRIAGRVLDQATGRPLVSARVSIIGLAGVVETDLDGRYRTPPVAVGPHRVRFALIGYKPVTVDSVVVKDGQTTIVNGTLATAPLELEELVVESAVGVRAASNAGLLAQQQASAVVQDGISAEAMSRTPDSDASDAIARVTGISVVDKKFVVVRGLSERYSGTLLNGAELASPEPLKKIVPLDIFPASLLESIVTTKGATPDKPGDFSGGLVEIKTKEFPEQFVAQLRVSQEYQSLSTFEKLGLPPRRGLDFAGFDDGRRGIPADAPAVGDTNTTRIERFAENIRNVWTPAPRTALPNLGLGFNVGGQLPLGSNPLGFVLALNYSSKAEGQPNRLFQFVSDTASGQPDRGFYYREATSVVDWGSILNFSTRLGQFHKLGFNNFYSRNAEEAVIQSTGFDVDKNANRLERYQVRYIERDLFQSQVTGEHFLPFLADSRVDWKVALASANRDEPDNRTATYIPDPSTGVLTLRPAQSNFVWFRFLDDRIRSGQLDWSLPLSIRARSDALLKVGGLVRSKDRRFRADLYNFNPAVTPPDGREVFQLPPEQAFAPENIGRNILFARNDGFALPYEVDDDVSAGYAMLDAEVVPRIRVVGGLRVEEWRLGLYQNTREAPLGEPTIRRNRDYLWSANLTGALSDRMNVRLAVARTVNRPDARELSPDEYVAIGGECSNQGNPNVRRAAILNGDVRWEWYPAPGEIVAVSGFYKRFTDPVVEIVDIQSSGNCRVGFVNAERASNFGGEVELRKQLSSLPGILGRLAIGANLTVVKSRVTLGEALGGTADEEIPLVGQSPFLLNGNLSYLDPEHGFDVTLLGNYFDDRVLRYGARQLVTGGVVQVPSITEEGRFTLDAKAQKAFGRLNLTLSGRNLTGAAVRNFQMSAIGRITTGFYRPGTSVSLGVGYDL